MSFASTKKELGKLDKTKLISLIGELYKDNKSVREYFEYYINPDENLMFEKYRVRVFEAFHNKKGVINLKDGKKALSDFRKLGTSPELLAELMFVYVETGIQLTNDYGDMFEGYYNSLESTYIAALTFMKKNNLLGKFSERASKIVDDTDNIGWGFQDALESIRDDFYEHSENIIQD